MLCLRRGWDDKMVMCCLYSWYTMRFTKDLKEQYDSLPLS